MDGHKDKKARVCLDARLTNEVLVKNKYPMPDLEGMVAKLSGRKYYASIDVKRAFLNLKFWDEESKHFTAFSVPSGQYRFKRLPYGLCNSIAIFQEVINEILEGPFGEDIFHTLMMFLRVQLRLGIGSCLGQ
jgi:hypothetical protein